MGIRFRCKRCETRLNIKATHAGKVGLCPKCKSKIKIPLESESDAPDLFQSVSTADSVDSFMLDKPFNPSMLPGHADPIEQKPLKIWYVRDPKLGEKGPLKGRELRGMIDDGVLEPDGRVWREDWEDWLHAGTVFPKIAELAKGTAALSYRSGKIRNANRNNRGRRFAVGAIAITAGLATIVVLGYFLYTKFVT